MKYLKIIPLSLILIFLLPGTGNTKTPEEISGKIIDGLRFLTEKEVKNGSLKLYRGDYVVFPANKDKKTTLVIKDLKIKHTFPSEQGIKKYVKFKKTGLYPFQYGNINGTVEVIEFAGANYQPVTAKEAMNIMANISPLILDVRTPGEYHREGYIKDSILLPVQVIQREYIKLLDYRDKPILIYCATGNRSTVAARILINNGFRNIYNMRYGIAEWKYRGFPVVKDK